MFRLINSFVLLFVSISLQAFQTDTVYFRINQVGYLPEDEKIGTMFSHQPIKEKVFLKDSDHVDFIQEIKAIPYTKENWGTFEFYYWLNFSPLKRPGKYYLQTESGKWKSSTFTVANQAYSGCTDDLLLFMRQQRCGYNPYLNMVCHKRDGRTMFGPMPDSTFIDLSGGWHDAGDQLKYLITGSYATAHMLKAYELFPDRFSDKVNALGQDQPNGIPDVLDEAKWGLDWILKMHATPDQLFHQIADDRDHRGWKMPDEDHSDYGWGKNSYRVAYFATGAPQGLREYKSEATGVANLAGRCAAALALGAKIWAVEGYDPAFSAQCQQAAESVYALGRKKEGFQQGNSYGAPYRYGEDTWADDMEWGAAELFALTQQKAYLEQAKAYALQANTVSWLPLDSAAHYRFYPFINIGHFALHPHVDKGFQKKLEGFYQSGIEHAFQRGAANPFNIGIPFIWCSNNLLTSLATQIILYEQMSGDRQYHSFLVQQRDWLFGRNPWGTSMYTGIPANGEYPLDVHTSIYALTKAMVPGGLVDGPVYATIYQSLKGIKLLDPDEFAHLQNKFVVYHDDIGDYSTNEPTMDGTAGSIIMMSYWSRKTD
jgi:hypothetical protein